MAHASTILNVRFAFCVLLSATLLSCDSKTDRLTANFSNEVDVLRSDLARRLTPDEQKRILAPYAAKMGEDQCQSIQVKILSAPLGLHQDPNDLVAPYKAHLSVEFKVLPIGHYLLESPEGWSVYADGHLHWHLRSTDQIIQVLTFELQQDANDNKVRTNPFSY